MIVVDTNIVIYFRLEGEMTAAARQVFARDARWAAPYLWRSEFRNVLAGQLRRGEISVDMAMAVAEQAESHLQGWEYHVASGDVLSYVSRSRCSAYDCEFVALAGRLGVPLVTSDKQVLTEFPKIAVSLSSFATG